MKIGGAIGQSALVGALCALGACAISFPDYTEGPIGAGGATASSSSSSSTSASSSSSSGTGGMGGMGGASSSSSSSTSASSSASSSSGAGGQGECAQPADCAGLPADDACQMRTCISTKCGQVFAPLSTPVPGVQTAGDCKVIECDGAGKQVTSVDVADVPNDNNACTTDTCNGIGKTPVNMSLPQGTSCGAASVCDGAPVNPKCQGCIGPMDCAGYVNDDCKQTTCLGGNCGTNFTGVGTPTANQAPGNCKTNVCDGAGNAHDVVAAGDVPVDGKDCTNDVCTGGTPSNPPVGIDAKCAGGYCDGAGTCAQCGSTPVGQCAAPPVCVNAACINHACGTMNVADGVNAPPGSQTSNDCTTVQCNGNGGTKAVANPGDLPIAANVCQVPGCNGMTPTMTAATAGTACNFMGAGKTVCDGVSTAGVCVQCVSPAQCSLPNNMCTNFTCGCVDNGMACSGGKNCGMVSNNCGTMVSCGACVDQGAASCGTTGACTTNQCVRYSAGTQCLAASCSTTGAGLQTTASTCNGTGMCTAGTMTSCNYEGCTGTVCKSGVCGMDVDCSNGGYCDKAGGGTCKQQIASGSMCNDINCKLGGCHMCAKAGGTACPGPGTCP